MSNLRTERISWMEEEIKDCNHRRRQSLKIKSPDGVAGRWAFRDLVGCRKRGEVYLGSVFEGLENGYDPNL